MGSIRQYTVGELKLVIEPFRGTRGTVLEALHLVQEHVGWISPEALQAVADTFNMTRNQLWGIVTFYADFRTQPPPPYVIGICHGPTCHIMGSERIQKVLEHHWRIRQDVPNPTGQVELKLIQCSGLCHLAPWLTLNNETLANVTPASVRERLQQQGVFEPQAPVVTGPLR
jgi:NADH:ubiquinone oxidoreductase subunit E